MRKFAIAAIAAASLAIAPAGAEPLSAWLGGWENPSGEIVAVTVSQSGGALSVSAKGQCTPNPCDWGSTPAVAYSAAAGTPVANDTQAIMAVFDAGFAEKTMVLAGLSGNAVRVHVYTRFTDGSGRSDYVLHGILRKARATVAPGAIGPIPVPGRLARAVKPFKEDCIAFNPAEVDVANPTGASWKLVQGSMWMLDAGPNKAEMDKAKAIVQHYGMNKQCFVGRPDPSLNYWLANDAAPSGAFPGEDCVSINPNALTVRDSGGHFTVVSGGNHFAFTAPTEAEAKEVIAVIKHYGFTRSCFVGRPGPSMSYLRK